jgi:hypothetical protein
VKKYEVRGLELTQTHNTPASSFFFIFRFLHRKREKIIPKTCFGRRREQTLKKKEDRSSSLIFVLLSLSLSLSLARAIYTKTRKKNLE